MDQARGALSAIHSEGGCYAIGRASSSDGTEITQTETRTNRAGWRDGGYGRRNTARAGLAKLQGNGRFHYLHGERERAERDHPGIAAVPIWLAVTDGSSTGRAFRYTQ